MQNLLTTPLVGTVVTVLLIALAVFVVFKCFYLTAATNEAKVISGLRKKPKVLIGHGGFRIPILDRVDKLTLEQISIDIKTNGFIPTQDFIGVDIDAVAKVQVDTSAEGMSLAMKNFLNMSKDQIRQALTDSLQGNMREIIGTVTLKDLCTDRKKFGDEVQEKAQKDMNVLGIRIASCNIQKMEDEKGLINELGQDNMSQIKKNASIAKANADRDIAIAEAQALKESNDAKVASATDIAIKQNELTLKNAELKIIADTKQAEADAAYEIKQEEQRKTIEIARQNANIARQEKEIEIKQKEASIKEQELEAVIKKQADAEKYRRERESEAQLEVRKREAEARKYELEKEAEALRISADAQKYEAEQKAEATRLVGLAEAEAIKAKALAEAEGIEKKAEAQAKMKDASVLEMYFNALPGIAASVAEPLKNVDSITMFGEGNNAKLIEDITTATTKVMSGLTEGMGINIPDMIGRTLSKGKQSNQSNVSDAEEAFSETSEDGDYREVE